jgi:hypothetical protein
MFVTSLDGKSKGGHLKVLAKPHLSELIRLICKEKRKVFQ